VLTVAKLLPLLLLIVAGIGSVKMSNLAWTETPAVSSVARASAVLIFAFFGVETALVASGEVRDSARTVPRAIFIAMVGAVLLYLALQIVSQGILGAALAGEKTPLAAAAAVVLGDSGRTFILVGSMISMFGYVCGATLGAPRMLFAFGRDGFLPAAVASIHPRFRTPHVAIAMQGVIVIGLAVTGSFETLVIVSNGSVLLVYAACCLGVIQLRRKKVRGAGTPFRVPFAAVIPVLATLAIAWLLTSLTLGEWGALVIVLVIALVAYAISLHSRRAALALGDTSA
jgi:basic amino acid/polyamine antiporter, APA family